MTSTRRHDLCLGLAVGVVLVTGGCGEPSTTATGSVAPSRASARHLANPGEYLSRDSKYPQWGFVTPSSAWICVIGSYPSGGDQAACAANPNQGPLTIPNVPFANADGGGDGTQVPNAIFVGEGVDATFRLMPRSIWDAGGTPRTLPFGTVLQAGGFSCNVQESTVSCRYDATGQGFSFSSSGYRFGYTEVPPG